MTTRILVRAASLVLLAAFCYAVIAFASWLGLTLFLAFGPGG